MPNAFHNSVLDAFLTLPSVPSIPQNVVATTSGTSATLTWVAPASNGGSPITGYTYSRDGTDSTGAGAYTNSSSLTASSTSVQFNQLVAGSTYNLSIAAFNAVGSSAAVTVQITVAAASTAPGVPTSVTATTTGTSATLTWTAPSSNGGSAITGYTVSRDGTDSTGAGAYTDSTVTASTTTYTFSQLVAGSTYNLTVAATNVVGSGTSVSKAITIASSGSGTTPTGTEAPVGVPGTWTRTFTDEFTGTSVDTTKWAQNWYGEGGTMNGVGTYAANLSVSNSVLTMTLASSSSGALIHTDISGGYKLPVGSYAEARISFPGSSTQLYNWPAWWASTSSADGWPSAGEHDIAEVLGGSLTVNYHSPSGSHNQGAVSGTWQNGYHTYGLYRKASSADVYWDGTLVKSYSTDDSGNPEILIINVGANSPSAYGTSSQVLVDYVRAWAPSS